MQAPRFRPFAQNSLLLRRLLLLPCSVFFFAQGLSAAELPLPTPPGQPGVVVEEASADPTPKLFREVASVTDVPQLWSPEIPLYVKGVIGIPPGRLEALAEWLRKNAPHWTVVIARGTEGEVYETLDGQSFTGLSAAENAMRRGLAANEGFSELRNEHTEERDGTFLLISLQDRAISYFSSEAQDRRDLGRRNWVSELDRPAIEAMRDGGRVLDAVQDTVSLIQNRMDERIQRELADREGLLAQAHASVERSKRNLSVLQQALNNFHQNHPLAEGDLANITIGAFRRSLESADRAVREYRGALAQQLSASIESEIDAAIASLDNHARAPALLSTLRERLAFEERRPGSVKAKPLFQATAEALDQARILHLAGQSAYQDYIESATRNLDAAKETLDRSETLERLTQWLVGIVAVLLLLLVLFFLHYANRVRRPAMLKAKQLLGERKAGLHSRTDKMLDLLNRSGITIGPRSQLESRNLRGTTMELSRSISSEVDSLFTLSSAAKRVVDEAEAIIHPRKIGAQLTNLFSRKPYERAAQTLTTKPTRFEQNEGVERLQESTQNAAPDANKASKPLEMTYDDLLAGFDRKVDQTEKRLSSLENAWQRVSPAIDEIQRKLDEASDEESALSAESIEDGLFEISTLLQTLLPAASSRLSEAVQLAPVDPLGALQQPIPHANRMATEATMLIQSLRAFRAQSLAAIFEAERQLIENGRATAWIWQTFDELQEQAEGLGALAVEESIQSRIEELKATLLALQQRVRSAVEIASVRLAEVWKEVTNAHQHLTDTRQQIAISASIPEAMVLADGAEPPDEILRSVQIQLGAITAELDRGSIRAAGEAVLEARDLLARVMTTIDEAALFVRGFQSRDTVLAGAMQAWELAAQKAGGDLAGGEKRYHTDALMIPTELDGLRKIHMRDQLSEMRQRYQANLETQQQARTLFLNARLTGSALALKEAEQTHELIKRNLRDFEEHLRLLDRLILENHDRAEHLRSRLTELNPAKYDHKTSRKTLAAIDECARALKRLDDVTPKEANHPLRLLDELNIMESQIENLIDRVRCDGDVYEEAARSLRAAASQLKEAEQLSTHSKTSAIANSPQLTMGREVIQRLRREYDTIAPRIDEAHGDWTELDRLADKITLEASRAAAVMKGELAQADSGATLLSQAATMVRDAAEWTGNHGVRIMGAPGSQLLESGRDRLLHGDYAEAQRLAQEAFRVAERALLHARQEVTRKERSMRMERTRLARSRQIRSVGGGLFSGGGFSSGGGGGGGGGSRNTSAWSTGRKSASASSSSGVARSGVGKSQSGVARSNW